MCVSHTSGPRTDPERATSGPRTDPPQPLPVPGQTPREPLRRRKIYFCFGFQRFQSVAVFTAVVGLQRGRPPWQQEVRQEHSSSPCSQEACLCERISFYFALGSSEIPTLCMVLPSLGQAFSGKADPLGKSSSAHTQKCAPLIC